MVVHKMNGDKIALCNGVPNGHAATSTWVDERVTCADCIKIMNIQKRNKQ